MTSSPLLTSVAEFVVTIRPMSQVGCASASWGVTAARDSFERPRNGPPLAVRINLATSEWAPDIKAWARAECSESTGTIWSARCRAPVTKLPPTIRLSLFANAKVAPDSRVARVGARPTEPVIPLRTTSQGVSRTNWAASPAPVAIRSRGTPSISACSRACSVFDPTPRPTTSKSLRWREITSIA